jgi:hypothetical protein
MLRLYGLRVKELPGVRIEVLRERDNMHSASMMLYFMKRSLDAWLTAQNMMITALRYVC